MTVCIAALADARKTLVLIADKMIGGAAIESEPEIEKIIEIHPNWRVMFSGNDIAPVFSVVDEAKKSLHKRRKIDVSDISQALARSYQEERKKRAEATYLSSLGLTADTFTRTKTPGILDTDRSRLTWAILQYDLDISLLVAGFDSSNIGHVFTVESGKVCRCDVPGYATVGSGAPVADYMMSLREMHPKMIARMVAYYAFEAKYFAERASGVGVMTDVYILRANKKPIKLDVKTSIEKKLVKICESLDMRDLDKKHKRQIAILNSIPEFSKRDFPVVQPRKPLL